MRPPDFPASRRSVAAARPPAQARGGLQPSASWSIPISPVAVACRQASASREPAPGARPSCRSANQSLVGLWRGRPPARQVLRLLRRSPPARFMVAWKGLTFGRALAPPLPPHRHTQLFLDTSSPEWSWRGKHCLVPQKRIPSAATVASANLFEPASSICPNHPPCLPLRTIPLPRPPGRVTIGCTRSATKPANPLAGAVTFCRREQEVGIEGPT
jgi:hypothetical protein